MSHLISNLTLEFLLRFRKPTSEIWRHLKSEYNSSYIKFLSIALSIVWGKGSRTDKKKRPHQKKMITKKGRNCLSHLLLPTLRSNAICSKKEEEKGKREKKEKKKKKEKIWLKALKKKCNYFGCSERKEKKEEKKRHNGDWYLFFSSFLSLCLSPNGDSLRSNCSWWQTGAINCP